MAAAGDATRLDLAWHPRAGDLPRALWRETFGAPHEGLFWFRAIEAGTERGQFDFRYGLLRRDGVPVGIVPAFAFDVPLDLVLPPAIARVILPVARGPLAALAHQRTLFIGNVAGEEGRVGLVPGVALAKVAAFVHGEARALANALGAPMLVWKDFSDADREALGALGSRPGVFRIPSYPGTEIPVLAGGHAAFLATQRSDRRRRIASKLKRGRAAVPLDTAVLVRPGDAEHAEMFALFEQTRARATTSFERLTPGFFRDVALAREAAFVVLREPGGGPMRAFMLVLDLGTRAVNQFIGLDYERHATGHLYFQLFAAAYDWAARAGAATLLSGQTGYMAKLDLGHRLVPLWNHCEHRSPLVNAVFRRAARSIGWETLDPQLAEYLAAHPGALPRTRDGEG
jgi:hypothetical protein